MPVFSQFYYEKDRFCIKKLVDKSSFEILLEAQEPSLILLIFIDVTWKVVRPSDFLGLN